MENNVVTFVMEMETSLGLTALLLSLPANQRVASRVDLEVKAPRLLSLAGF